MSRPINFAALKKALAETRGDAMETARLIGCTPKTVRIHALAHGLTVVPRGRGHWARQIGPRKIYTDEMIKSALAAAGDDIDEAARALGCGNFTVYAYRARMNLPRRIAAGPALPWTPERIAKLQALVWANPRPPIYDLAKAMGTTVSGVQTAMSRFGIVQQRRAMARGNTVKQRSCIACARPFISEGSHNRQCQRCYSIACEVA
ncbi:hypothetical protein FIU28_17425 [Tardiphaga sp. vice154]|uniref:hypothetical protein n=1 Tax=Tardiphaga sp. vice154 TaxID=2592814 RepID=UPI00116215B2|nr:hypothetical protein [Tardiphaga sp. vice154]QDM22733.1 hypothetical protein FIU28_17425 [Tardiphaga sp. vice154]